MPAPASSSARPAAVRTTGAARRDAVRTAVQRRRRRRAARALLVCTLVVLVGATSFVGGLLAAPFDDTHVPPPPRPVLILASDGTQIGSIRPVERRELVPPEAIPQAMRDAIIAAEDERFLEHRGVDPLGITRAFLRDVTGGRTQGGSTLTQQYVKNVYVGNERSLTRKVREAAIAYRLERRRSKEQILTDYLNVLFLGNGTYGVQAASRYYFGVDVRDLDLDPATGQRDETLALARATLLAGIAPAPSAWNPVHDMTLAKARQRYVLNRMVTIGTLTTERAGEVYAREVAIVRETPPPTETTAPEFADLVTDQLRARYAGDDEDLLFRGGLRVRTTLDVDWQEAVTRAAREVLPDVDDPQAAVVAVDMRSGDVKAMTTLRRYPRKTDRQGGVREPLHGYERFGFNLATRAHRSVGSTLKPFILAEALEQGHSLDERRSAPACHSIPNPAGAPNPYRYCNAAGEGGGSSRVTLRQALQRSVNTVYVPLANEVGRGNVAQLLLDAGAEPRAGAPLRSGNLSFGLGAGVEVTPLSMASAYGTLLNGGVRVPPRFVLETRNDAGAVVDAAGEPEGTPVLPREVAEDVVDAMSGVTAPAGTAARARQPFPVYGKTGTTNDSVDAWFIGCVRDPYHLCLATWMGYEDQTCEGVDGDSCGGMQGVHGVRQVYGGTLPAEVFARTMDAYREIQASKSSTLASAAAQTEPVPPPEPAAAPRD